MTFAPKSLIATGAEYESHGGRLSGIVGDARHQATAISYHNGKSDLRPDAYSACLPRDKAGLTEAASAIDLGAIDKSYVKLRRFTKWSVERFMARDPLFEDCREIVGSLDGKTVYGWVKQYNCNVGSTAIKVIKDYGDDTHLWHTHWSRYRDREQSDSFTRAIKAYFEPAVEDNVQTFQTPTVPSVADVVAGATLHTSSDLKDANPIKVNPGRAMPFYGVPYPGVAMVQYTSDEPGNAATGKVLFTKVGSTSNIIPAPQPADPTPFSQADLDSAREAGVDEGAMSEAQRISRRIFGPDE